MKYTYMWNIHMHRNPEALTTFFSSGTKLLLPSWLLVFSTRGERDTISTMLIVPSNRTTHGHPVVHYWTGLAQVQKSTRFVQLQISTYSFFLKPPKILSPSLPGMTSFTSPVPFRIRGFYYIISDCNIHPARAWKPAVNACPYPCTKPNISKPN